MADRWLIMVEKPVEILSRVAVSVTFEFRRDCRDFFMFWLPEWFRWTFDPLRIEKNNMTCVTAMTQTR